ILLAVYGLFFALSVHKLHHEDILIWLKCEEEIAKMIWGEVFTPPEIKRARHKSCWPCLLSIGQFLVTSLFGAALVYAVHTKAAQVKLDTDHRSTLTIQQNAPYKMIIEPRSK
ncbi:MAG: hypothetical protein VKM17_01890, partial [Cyanobacteriota bacterium]|nr:hypothetical protein [Cyanobacteriota bacterium]